MPEATPYVTLQNAVSAYGEAAMENFLRCRALGHAVAEGLDAYLKAPKPCVALVPAQGPFDPEKTYGDKAFSFDPGTPIRLEPIAFGICVVIPNREDSGTLWVRTGLLAEVKEERFEVMVANQPVVRIPLAFDGELTPIFDSLMTEFLQLFRKDLAAFGDPRYQNRIGFLPHVPAAPA